MVQRICKIVSALIMTAMVALALVLIVPYLLGWKPFVVLTGSMQPAIPTGSIVYARPVEPESVAVGDIITYTSPIDDLMITHRVVEILPESREFVTQGDSNRTQDQPVSFDRLVGKRAFSLPVLGNLSLLFRSRQGIPVIGGVLIVLILINFLPGLFKKEPEEAPANK